MEGYAPAANSASSSTSSSTPLRLDHEAYLSYLRHELASPLAVIDGVLETLSAYGDQLGEQGRLDLHSRARRQLQLCWHILEQLSSADRLRRGEFHVEPERVELAEVLEKLIDDCQTLLYPVPLVVVTARPPLPAVVDVEALHEILMNLCKNARDHGNPADREAPVVITAANDGDTVVIHVEDHGPGFPERLRGEVFEPGTRHAGSRGLGLGLFICRHLAEALGGGIEIGDSERTGGARVTVRLPSV